MGAAADWRVAGTYLESCSCEAICPCRTIDGVRGGRSTYGICEGALSWLIERGHAGEVDLSGLAVAKASRYSDDEEGSPWTVALYVDERGDDLQRQALTDIFLGWLPGSQIDHFPWAWKPSNVTTMRVARIEIDHTPRRGWFRVRDVVSVRIAGRYESDEIVRCVIPGYDRPGQELIADQLRVRDGPLDFEFHGNCAYESTFEYVGRG